MSLDPLTAAFDLGSSLIKRIWPDPEKQAEELTKLTKLKQDDKLAELQAQTSIMLAQINVNAEAAKSDSVFVSGARPFILWVCGAGLGYTILIYPFMTWIWAALKATGHIPLDSIPPPELDSSAITGLVSGLLGLGTMRSVERVKGVQRNTLK
jgi:hypothetical protein